MSCCKTKCNKRGEQGPPGPRGRRGASSTSIGSTIIPYASGKDVLRLGTDDNGLTNKYNIVEFGSNEDVLNLTTYCGLGFRAPRNGTLKSLYGFFRPNGEFTANGDVTITMGIYETVPTGAQILTQIASVDFEYAAGDYTQTDFRVAETDSLNVPIVKGNIYTCVVYATASGEGDDFSNSIAGFFSGGMTI